MSWRKFFIAFAVLTGLAGIILWWLLPQLLSANSRYAEMPTVVGMPAPWYGALPAYDGPHPSQWQRPADPFEYPIKPGQTGPHEPYYAGPNRYPFACDGEASGLGQPLVDNRLGHGIPVYAEPLQGNPQQTHIIGYSRDCLYPTQVDYYYNRIGTERFFPLEQAGNDIAQITLGGRKIDFIVRVETGTINRYIYTLTTLKGPRDTPVQADNRYWNRVLLYQFRGGVGIGGRQGRISPNSIADRRIEQLRQGYAVAYSTANQSSNHYDPWLSEETALRVKRQFIASHGEPRFTIGIGGSGGAIQQYLIAQNGSDLLDAGLALYSYPDMVSQTIHVFDCELIEYYLDIQSDQRWPWSSRKIIEGMNSADGGGDFRTGVYEIGKLVRGRLPTFPPGSSECVHSWRGLTPLVHNPRFVHFSPRFSAEVEQQTRWSYWDQMRHVFGAGKDGFAHHPWDNQGVQYGLGALKRGEISVDTFLDLNARVGGWKPLAQMQAERYSYLVGERDILSFDPWSSHNMQLSPDEGVTPAPRSKGADIAVTAAVQAGIIFTGEKLPIPVIDLRHYLDPELDMHHLVASFSTRARLARHGNQEQMRIWVSDAEHDPVQPALDILERWLASGKRPEDAQDRCFDAMGNTIAAGEDVWNGDWNGKPAGACLQQFPAYTTSRMEAGAPVAGDLFKCSLMPVSEALAQNLYAPVDMRAHRVRLEQIFPDGVCDHRQPGLVERLSIRPALQASRDNSERDD